MQWPLPMFPTQLTRGGFAALSTDDAGTPNVKGEWAAMIAAPAAASWVNFRDNGSFSLNGDWAALVDLAVGTASAPDTIVAANLVMGYREYRGTMFPLHVPAGATLWGRLASPLPSGHISARVDLFYGEPAPGVTTAGRITTYGAVPSTSGGTIVSPSSFGDGGFGSYAELAAATTAPIHALMVLTQGTDFDFFRASYSVDIAVGAPGQETVVLPGHSLRTDSDTHLFFPTSPEFYPLSLSIPAGVRIAARTRVTSGSVIDPIEVAVYGFTF